MWIVETKSNFIIERLDIIGVSRELYVSARDVYNEMPQASYLEESRPDGVMNYYTPVHVVYTYSTLTSISRNEYMILNHIIIYTNYHLVMRCVYDINYPGHSYIVFLLVCFPQLSLSVWTFQF